ncbi:hypothetical protein C1645_836207 [Glomus cerebriforme]|uniref:Uncharacterized protein n=1 Tax=Glomus cerebriforme TaxID=658196 RepID=A0A397SD08_9GLOM|nr:hypothetical protein C1645_836207 [Glomus cerebriforme]
MGFAQNPELSSDPSSYSKEYFASFIEFTKFISKFLKNAYSYKKIIPEELCDNLIKYFLDYDKKYLEKAIYCYNKEAEQKLATYQHTLKLGAVALEKQQVEEIVVVENWVIPYFYHILLKWREGNSSPRFSHFSVS